MLQKVLTAGALCGALCGAMISAINIALPSVGLGYPIVGFAVMFVVFSAIYLVVRKHRNQTPGGQISFGAAVGLGLVMTLAATLVYCAAWEIYYAATDYAFYDDYVNSLILAEQQAGTTGSTLDEFIVSMDKLSAQLADPLFRVPMTSVEILPVGVLVSLVSGLLLRRRTEAQQAQ